MTVDMAYQYLFTGALTVLAILIGIILVRSIIGPRITDRILCINMIGTLVICSIAILSQMLKEDYLTDIALIYAMLSFLTVLILASVYIRRKDPKQDVRENLTGGDPEGGLAQKSRDEAKTQAAGESAALSAEDTVVSGLQKGGTHG